MLADLVFSHFDWISKHCFNGNVFDERDEHNRTLKTNKGKVRVRFNKILEYCCFTLIAW